MINYKNNIMILHKKTSKELFRISIILTFFILISLTFFRCANMARPTGGPKDTIPPVILNETPPNFSTNFTAKRISLQFDEYIKLNNPNKEFSISPDTDKQPEYRVKKKSLQIILPDSLEKNTTYTINFGKGLIDFNEGNPIINYSYVFSTGPELDSLRISGSVKNAYTKTFDEKDDKDVRVLLIPTSQDSIFGKKKANIYTTVDSSGNFKFNNLRENTYRIYAIKEQNNDRIYNSDDESIGFIMDSIILNENISNIKLEFSKGKPKKFRTIEKKIEKDGKVLLVFNQPIDTPVITLIDPVDYNSDKIIRFSNSKDSASIFLKDMKFDSLKFEIRNNNTVLDTTLIRRSKNEKYERIITPLLNINNKVDRIKHITITSNYPIDSAIKENFILKEDSIERRNFQLQKDSLVDDLYHLRFNWRPKKNYELIIQEKALLGPFEEFNKESKYTFTYNESDNYGDIRFTLNNLNPEDQYIVELIDDKSDKTVDSRIISGNEVNYIKFPGGKYRLRVIKDINKNGRWDGADVYNKIQAEPIWYMDKPFTIRSNWEQTENLNVNFE